MQTFDPNQAVIPILRGKDGPTISEILGTGFFVKAGDKALVVTAKHVFEDNPLSEGEFYAYACKTNNDTKVHSVRGFHFSKVSDVACFEPVAFEEAVSIPFAAATPPLNRDVICYEYSQSRVEARADGGVHVSLEPFAHKGNVMKYTETDLPPYVDSPCFVVSFPALRGASGAPIICYTDKRNFYVAGMIVANIGRHLMPAQIERVADDSGSFEEVSYFLPLGIAIQSKILREALSEVGELEFVE